MATSRYKFSHSVPLSVEQKKRTILLRRQIVEKEHLARLMASPGTGYMLLPSTLTLRYINLLKLSILHCHMYMQYKYLQQQILSVSAATNKRRFFY